MERNRADHGDKHEWQIPRQVPVKVNISILDYDWGEDDDGECSVDTILDVHVSSGPYFDGGPEEVINLLAEDYPIAPHKVIRHIFFTPIYSDGTRGVKEGSMYEWHPDED